MKLDYISIGKNVKKHRNMSGLTQAELAELIGCSDRHIGQIETGRGIPSLATTAAIANALNVGIDQLMYGDLNNRTDYFLQELSALTDKFNGKDKLMTIEIVKAIVSVLEQFRSA